MNAPNGKRFVWGKIVEVHWIDDLAIVEYIPEHRQDSRAFHPYVNCGPGGKNTDTCRSFPSLKRAIVGAIAYESEGPNAKADVYFYRMIDKNS